MYKNYNKSYTSFYQSQRFDPFLNSRSSSTGSKNLPKGKKINLKDIPKKTCTSLIEVECFLCNFSSLKKYLKIYNLLKK